MKESWISIIENFKSYLGNGWLMWTAFCIALLVCLIKGGDRRKKIVTFCAVAMLVIFNPLVYRFVGQKFLSGVYWRLFWILPTVTAVAVVLTDFVSEIKIEFLRLAAAAVLCIAIAKTGTFFFNGTTYCKAENDYQIPQIAIDLSDEILKITNGADCMVIVPNELVCYIRQYTSAINLFYGRNMWGFMNNPTEGQVELYQLMNAEEIDYALLHDTAAAYGCHYIVFNSDARKLPENMESYGFTLQGRKEPYLIYSLE